MRDAGAGSGALQAIQQAGGALGVAVVSQIFFSRLAAETASGAVQTDAFAGAMSTAMIYNLCAYVVAAAGALMLRATVYADAPPQPVVVE